MGNSGPKHRGTDGIQRRKTTDDTERRKEKREKKKKGEKRTENQAEISFVSSLIVFPQRGQGKGGRDGVRARRGRCFSSGALPMDNINDKKKVLWQQTCRAGGGYAPRGSSIGANTLGAKGARVQRLPLPSTPFVQHTDTTLKATTYHHFGVPFSHRRELTAIQSQRQASRGKKGHTYPMSQILTMHAGASIQTPKKKKKSPPPARCDPPPVRAPQSPSAPIPPMHL